MLRSIVSSIEFEKFRRNWSEKNSTQRFLIITLPTSIWISILNLWELRQILCKTEFPTLIFGWG
ncbi:hypothetical protein [Leptospira noguchii]|uniref:Uncharacterized protein n=1 Tax=Leptospira noguchii TaxID=28182 RepID=A0AAE9GIW2_9LEPT|nr:hypothetical protein [Leptospira noguchii]UOG57428.1 hypothetical protein MAL03_04520 [Leptospira noguchii]